MLPWSIWCLIICCVILHSHRLFSLPIFTTGLEVLPLWNDIPNTSHPCIINNSTAEQGFITFHGSPYLTCSLQVTSSQHVLIEITGGITGDGILFVDLLKSCPYRYSTAVIGEEQSCNLTIVAESFLLSLQSNGTLSIMNVESTKSESECSGLMQGSESGVYDKCPSWQNYRNASHCDNEMDTVGYCELRLPSHCNNSVSKYEATLQCYESETEEVLLVYDVGITQLILSNNGIARLDNNTFSNLKNLKELNLDYNRIEKLQNGVFHGLGNLRMLSLLLNELVFLDNSVFRELVKLEKLDLTANNLISLPSNLIQGLSNLMDVQLAANMLVTLDSKFFNGLFEVHTINLFKNHIRFVPSDLFKDLRNLQYLWLSLNYQLDTLPARLFQSSVNLKHLYLNNNNLGSLPVGIFNNITNVTNLVVQNNPLRYLDGKMFQGLDALKRLSLRNISLSKLPVEIFQGLGSLEGLTVGYNKLKSLDEDVFRGLHNLTRLTMQVNYLTTLPLGIFYDLKNLAFLKLNMNNFTSLDPDIFQNLAKLLFLDISNNNLINIQMPLQILRQLTIFVINHNPMTEVSKNSLLGLTNNTQLIVSQNEICECFAPKEVNCSVDDDRSPYLTCDRLLSDRFLVVVMWLIALLSIAGNLFVVVWKQSDSKGNKVQLVLLTNLAVSDFLMGVYMIIIAIADVYFGNQFPLQSEQWRSSVTCRIAGTLSVLSSEASVFFVMLISIDRFLHMVFPFSNRHFNRKFVLLVSCLTWLIAFVLALVPNMLSGQNFKFYENSHVCIGFPLALLETFTKQPLGAITWDGFVFLFSSSYSHSNGFTTGLYYSTALFLGLNSLCYLIILGCYIAIIRTVKASSKRSGRSQDMNTQIKLTIKVTAIVATDFLCWFPIIILGIFVQARAITLPPSVFAWLITCVLPINSAVNPYLYTISDIITKQRKKSESLRMKTQSSAHDS